MTSLVPIEAPPGASPLAPGNPSVAVADPALAAEFAAMLGAASPAVAPAELAVVSAIAIEAPPGPEPNVIIPALEREGELELARSAAPIEILDSPLTRNDTQETEPVQPGGDFPSVLEDLDCILRAPVLPQVSVCQTAFPSSPMMTIATAEGPKTLEGFTKKVDAPRAFGPLAAAPPESDLQKSDAVVATATEAIGATHATEASTTDAPLPEALLASVTSISGGASEFFEGDREGSSDETLVGEIAQGEATTLITDDAEGFAVTRTERLEARPLDRTERTKIVHQVIDRVTKHVETLAVARSKEPLTIHLEPADFGRVVVEISRETSGLVAEMSATDPRVTEALDRHRSELAAGLAAKGHVEARITVTAAATSDNPAFDLHRDGGHNAQQQQQQAFQSHRDNSTPNSATSFATTAARPRTRIRAAGLDLEI